MEARTILVENAILIVTMSLDEDSGDAQVTCEGSIPPEAVIMTLRALADDLEDDLNKQAKAPLN